MNDIRHSETAHSRCRAGSALSHGAELQRFHGAAGHRRRAARALRSGEMGPDHRQLAAAARGVREKRRGQGAARAGAVVAESQEGARRAGAGDSRLRHALLRAPAAAVPQSAGAELVRDHAGGDPHHGAAQRHAAGRLSDAGGARDRARLRPDVGIQERRGGCRVLPRRPFQIEFPVLPRPRRSVDLAETGLSFRVRRGLHHRL